MKIAVYHIVTVTPKDENEYNDICDILNIPTLKYGSVELIGSFSHWITKTDLKKMDKIERRYYDRSIESFRSGLLLTGFDKKYFAQL